MAGGGSFTSDQTTLQMDTASVTLLRAARTRVTSIQGEGIAGAQLLLHDAAATSDTAAGNLKATYNFGTEGLSVYVPGSGILFKDGVCGTLTGSGGSVTLTITGA